MGSEEVAWQRSVFQTSILVAPPKVREAFLAAQAIIESSKKIEQYCKFFLLKELKTLAHISKLLQLKP